MAESSGPERKTTKTKSIESWLCAGKLKKGQWMRVWHMFNRKGEHCSLHQGTAEINSDLQTLFTKFFALCAANDCAPSVLTALGHLFVLWLFRKCNEPGDKRGAAEDMRMSAEHANMSSSPGTRTNHVSLCGLEMFLLMIKTKSLRSFFCLWQWQARADKKETRFCRENPS